MLPLSVISKRKRLPSLVSFNVAEPMKFAPVWLVILSSPEMGTDPLSMGLAQLLSVPCPETA